MDRQPRIQEIMKRCSRHPDFHSIKTTYLIFMYSISFFNSVSVGASVCLFLFLCNFPEVQIIAIPIAISAFLFSLHICFIIFYLKLRDIKPKVKNPKKQCVSQKDNHYRNYSKRIVVWFT